MVRRGGKGKVSNDLVAASCAAILTVYTAGYWRTRDEARRMETQAGERRPVHSVQSPPTAAPVIVAPAAAVHDAEPEAVVPAVASQPVAPPVSIPAAAAPTVAPVTAKAAAKVEVQPEPQPVAVTEVLADEAEPVVEPVPDPVLPEPAGHWQDGTYTSWGTSRHGDIKAQVVIRDGRIVEAGIASCETRYPCDVISTIIPQPVERQSPDVDRVSRATESADAYYYGLLYALKEAEVPPPADPAAPQ